MPLADPWCVHDNMGATTGHVARRIQGGMGLVKPCGGVAQDYRVSPMNPWSSHGLFKQIALKNRLWVANTLDPHGKAGGKAAIWRDRGRASSETEARRGIWVFLGLAGAGLDPAKFRS
jgi:hypothetical protein